jgi:signal transduction histidine kinase
MVGILPGAEEDRPQVVVVRPALLMASARRQQAANSGESERATPEDEISVALDSLRLLPAGEPGGYSLGSALNGLRASFPPGFRTSPELGGVEGWFFRILLPLILVLTGFTAYFAWRDVRRETEAVRLRSQFVSSVTHELKTPLTSIRMFAETLRLGRHSGPEAQKEYLDTVVQETKRLGRLINNVLDFARIERGEKTYQMAATDLGAAAREAARAVAYPLAQGGYTLTTDISEDLPVVQADADALTQALLNLLSNAIKFSKEGSGIHLRVLQEGGEILLQVEDRGRGIAPPEKEAIFRDFYRTSDAEKEGIPGTGLGLSLVAHVADAHGGRVEVESEVGRGSTFTIRIPAAGGTREEDPHGQVWPPSDPVPDEKATRVGSSPAPEMVSEEEDTS